MGKNISFEEEQYKRLIDLSPMPIGIHVQGKLVYANQEVVKLIGAKSVSQILHKPVLQFIHPDYHDLVQERIMQVYKLGRANTDLVEEKLIRLDGSVVDVELVSMLIDYNGNPAIQFFIRDITAQKKAQKQREFLEKATNILISSLEYETTLANISELIVPFLADYCRIVVLDDQGEVQDVAVNHSNPEKNNLVKKLYETYKKDPTATHGVVKILQSGNAELISHVNQVVLQPFDKNQSMMKVVKNLEVKSYMGVPLIIRGKTEGVITFTSTQEGRFYTEDDLLFARDLAQRISLILENTKLFSNVKTALHLRDDFLSVASHELKTPITSLKGFTQIMQSGVKDFKKTSYYLKRMDDQINRLTGLVNDLLDVSKIQRGKLEFEMQEFELNSLIHESIEEISNTESDHKIIFHHNGAIKLYADKYRINQVIINLLTNAIKYSPDSDKVIIRTDKNESEIVMEVEDYGIGVQEKNISRIFEPFYQVNTNTRRSLGGLGLGLHISKVIMERHGGDILVENKKDKGSIFKAVFPMN